MCNRCKIRGFKKIDRCMFIICKRLENDGLKVRGSCCGHGRYPPTIIVEDEDSTYEFISTKPIYRKSRFYKKDKEGFYYVLETIDTKCPL